MPHKDLAKRREYQDKYNNKNKEQNNKYYAKRREDLKQHAYDSMTVGEIIDICKWDMWCNNIKNWVKNTKHPYCSELTNNIIFDMMKLGCYYCGQLATTIDRVDSTLAHTLDNCVGCCVGCNKSKGTADQSTFIRKAYYRARGKYYDDDVDIWFVNKTKPSMCHYKIRAKKQGVKFDLLKEYFDMLTKRDCAYCGRSPTTWFGIDRTVPSEGYVIDNVVTCCFDCNLDKLDDAVKTMIERNERIASRVDAGKLIVSACDKAILHKGTQKTSKKVYAYGRVYANKQDASRALGKDDSHVCKCIKQGRQSDDIFEISDEFYEKYKDSDTCIDKPAIYDN